MYDNEKSFCSRVGKRILQFKSKLPANGDFLFVTETPARGGQEDIDLADRYKHRNAVLNQLRSNDLDVIKLIYERAKIYESKVEMVDTVTRDKAKTLVGVSSLTSAIFLGFVSAFSSAIPKFNWWILLIELLLFIFLASHLLNALLKALESLTREVSEWPGPQDFLLSRVDVKPYFAFSEAIAQIVSSACKNLGYIHERNNKVQIAQHAFYYALIYFLVFVMFHILALSIPLNTNIDDPMKKAFASMEKIPTAIETISISINSERQEQMTAIKELSTKLSTIDQASRAIIFELREQTAAIGEANTKLSTGLQLLKPKQQVPKVRRRPH